jgi:hypothetical protein
LLVGCVTLQPSPIDDSNFYDRYLYTIPKHEKWELVGEWEYPGKDEPRPFRYTTSIVKVRGNYVEIYSGDVLSGCCFWPQGYLLVRGEDGAFFNALTEVIYSIQPDGSLTVVSKDGKVTKATRTTPDQSFVPGWEPR